MITTGTRVGTVDNRCGWKTLLDFTGRACEDPLKADSRSNSATGAASSACRSATEATTATF